MRNLIVASLVVNAMLGASAALHAQNFAAHAPATEKQSPVAWGATEMEAARETIQACKRVSRQCSSTAGVTDNLDEIFVTMCCTRPRRACQTTAGKTIEEGKAGSIEVFSEAGYSNCTMRSAVSARTGKPVPSAARQSSVKIGASAPSAGCARPAIHLEPCGSSAHGQDS